MTKCTKCGSATNTGTHYPSGDVVCFECWLASDEPTTHPEHMRRAHANAMHLADQYQAELRESIKAAAIERDEPLSKVTRTLTGYAQAHTRESRRLVQNIGLAALAGLTRLAAEKCEEHLPRNDDASDHGEAIETLKEWAAAEPGRIFHVGYRDDMPNPWAVSLHCPGKGGYHTCGQQLQATVEKLLRIATKHTT